jgi:antitoxin (DNA-binding transcriptional repressor) of toxin-antitoxin stability system
MQAVGVREFKDRLSAYIRKARGGQSVLITDRGEVVAELGPPGHHLESSPHPPGLQALARRGLATLGQPNEAAVYRPLRRALAPGRSKTLLDAERGSR